MMTSDDIIRMAKEAGLPGCPDELERFAALVAAAEREECARLCDWLNGEKRLTPVGCAAAIRARSKT